MLSLNKIPLAALLLAVFIAGWVISPKLGKNPFYDPTTPQAILAETTTSPVPKDFLVTIGHNTILVKPEEIVINEGFDDSDINEFKVKKVDYPDLFDLQDKYSRIHITEVGNSVENDNGLIYIANQRPNHGTINDGYFIKIDPDLKKVVDTGWKRLFGTVRLFSSCNGCSLPLVEFRKYDSTTGEYLLVNAQNRSAFIKLRSELEDINKKEVCRIDGNEQSLEKALSSARDRDKCGDQGMGISTDEPAEEFITLGQYREIMMNIDRIIKGENIKVFERI